jgi:hypothetical protein
MEDIADKSYLWKWNMVILFYQRLIIFIFALSFCILQSLCGNSCNPHKETPLKMEHKWRFR